MKRHAVYPFSLPALCHALVDRYIRYLPFQALGQAMVEASGSGSGGGDGCTSVSNGCNGMYRCRYARRCKRRSSCCNRYPAVTSSLRHRYPSQVSEALQAEVAAAESALGTAELRDQLVRQLLRYMRHYISIVVIVVIIIVVVSSSSSS